MKLSDIVQLNEGISETELKAKLTKLYNDKKDLTYRAGSLGHGSIKPEFIPQIDRLKAEIKATQEQLKVVQQNERDGTANASKELKQELSTRNDNKSEVATRKSAAHSEGNKAANAFVKKHGGYTGVADYLEKKIKSQTKDGTEDFDAQILADEVGITKGSISRWLRRPEFKKLTKYTK